MASNKSVSDDGLTFTPLLYGNGPGRLSKRRDYNLTEEMTSKTLYRNYLKKKRKIFICYVRQKRMIVICKSRQCL